MSLWDQIFLTVSNALSKQRRLWNSGEIRFVSRCLRNNLCKRCINFTRETVTELLIWKNAKNFFVLKGAMLVGPNEFFIWVCMYQAPSQQSSYPKIRTCALARRCRLLSVTRFDVFRVEFFLRCCCVWRTLSSSPVRRLVTLKWCCVLSDVFHVMTWQLDELLSKDTVMKTTFVTPEISQNLMIKKED